MRHFVDFLLGPVPDEKRLAAEDNAGHLTLGNVGNVNLDLGKRHDVSSGGKGGHKLDNTETKRRGTDETGPGKDCRKRIVVRF